MRDGRDDSNSCRMISLYVHHNQVRSILFSTIVRCQLELFSLPCCSKRSLENDIIEHCVAAASRCSVLASGTTASVRANVRLLLTKWFELCNFINCSTTLRSYERISAPVSALQTGEYTQRGGCQVIGDRAE